MPSPFAYLLAREAQWLAVRGSQVTWVHDCTPRPVLNVLESNPQLLNGARSIYSHSGAFWEGLQFVPWWLSLELIAIYECGYWQERQLEMALAMIVFVMCGSSLTDVGAGLNRRVSLGVGTFRFVVMRACLRRAPADDLVQLVTCLVHRSGSFRSSRSQGCEER